MSILDKSASSLRGMYHLGINKHKYPLNLSSISAHDSVNNIFLVFIVVPLVICSHFQYYNFYKHLVSLNYRTSNKNYKPIISSSLSYHYSITGVTKSPKMFIF